MNEEHIKLALKHKLAMAYSVELVGRSDALDLAFNLAEAMIQRMDKELSALMPSKPNLKDAMGHDMFVILEALAKHSKA